MRRANDTRFGLAASVWTEDYERGAEIAKRIEAGTVWVNHHVGSEADMPFGGFKESGLGREIGSLGLASYMEPQVIKVPLRGIVLPSFAIGISLTPPQGVRAFRCMPACARHRTENS